MQTHTPVQPWNGARMGADLVKIALGVPRVRLDRLEASEGPGTYLQFFARPSLKGIFGATIATGVHVAYVGTADNLHKRMIQHRNAIRGIESISESDVFVTLLPMDLEEDAAFGERSLIKRLGPVLNGMGWGCNRPGGNRIDEDCNSISALLPGRYSARRPTERETAEARLRLLTQILAADPNRPRWAQLTR
jgi:hypothetical protein